MITSSRFLCLFCLFTSLSFPGFSQDTPLRTDFSGKTAEENKLTIMGAGFGAMPLAKVAFGDVITDNVFAGATDGKGVVITANPGESALIFLPPIYTTQMALLRCSVRTDSADASIYLASIDQGANSFVSTMTPNNGGFFLNQWKRLSIFALPPSNGFQPLIQVVNTSKTKPLAVYIDNYDIYLLEKGRFYSEEFLNGDEIDPATISITPDATQTPAPTPIPEITPTVTVLPSFTSIPTPTQDMNAGGEFHQWAVSAEASSQFRSTAYSAMQATGQPDTLKYGDYGTAWAPLTNSAGEEWLHLNYQTPVLAKKIRIHETNNNGFIYQVDLFDTAGTLHTVWTGEDKTPQQENAWLEIAFEPVPYAVNGMKIHTRITGWEEIDAVELIGNIPPETPPSPTPSVTPAEIKTNTPVSTPTPIVTPVTTRIAATTPTPVVTSFPTTTMKPDSTATPVSTTEPTPTKTPAEGEFRQWAASAEASSQFRNSTYSAGQATGEPNTPKNGDYGTAWAPLTNGAGEEWLLLKYQTPVFAAQVRVHETNNNGFIYQVDLLDIDGVLHTIWTGEDKTPRQDNSWFEISFDPVSYKTIGVKLYTRITGWEEVDAVELIGILPPDSPLPTPEPMLTPAPTAKSTSTPIPSSTIKPISTSTATATPKPALTATVTPKPSSTSTATLKPTSTLAPTATFTPSVTNTPIATRTPSERDSRQWAIAAEASSEFRSTSYSAKQATGEPNTANYGDFGTAWAPFLSGLTEEWLRLNYLMPVNATQVRVHETNNNGFIYQVDFIDSAGASHTIWKGSDTTPRIANAWFEISFDMTPYEVTGIKIFTKVEGWEEIDAVELIGLLPIGYSTPTPTLPPTSTPTPTPIRTPTPVPTLDNTVLADTALARINAHRSAVGLNPMVLHPSLILAAQAHSHYMVLNGLNHKEEAGKPGFTGISAWDRAPYFGFPTTIVMEGIGQYFDSPSNAVDLQVAGPLHRYPILHSGLTQLGYGQEEIFYTLNYGSLTGGDNSTVIYPGDNQKDVPISFQGGELPEPFPGANYPVGFAITLFGPKQAGMMDIKTYSLHLVGGNDLAIYTCSPASNGYPYIFAFAAMSPLIPNTEYEAHIKAIVSGETIDHTWRFTTAASAAAKIIKNKDLHDNIKNPLSIPLDSR